METHTKSFITWLRNFFKKDTRVVLIQLYLFVIVFGFVLTLLYAAYPSLLTCSKFFGDEFCTPTGIFVGLLASIPGYVVAGNVLSSFNQLPGWLSLTIVIATSVFFYYLIGLVIDKLRRGKLSLAEKIVIVAFIILVVFVILFLVRLM